MLFWVSIILIEHEIHTTNVTDLEIEKWKFFEENIQAQIKLLKTFSQKNFIIKEYKKYVRLVFKENRRKIENDKENNEFEIENEFCVGIFYNVKCFNEDCLVKTCENSLCTFGKFITVYYKNSINTHNDQRFIKFPFEIEKYNKSYQSFTFPKIKYYTLLQDTNKYDIKKENKALFFKSSTEFIIKVKEIFFEPINSVGSFLKSKYIYIGNEIKRFYHIFWHLSFIKIEIKTKILISNKKFEEICYFGLNDTLNFLYKDLIYLINLRAEERNMKLPTQNHIEKNENCFFTPKELLKRIFNSMISILHEHRDFYHSFYPLGIAANESLFNDDKMIQNYTLCIQKNYFYIFYIIKKRNATNSKILTMSKMFFFYEINIEVQTRPKLISFMEVLRNKDFFMLFIDAVCEFYKFKFKKLKRNSNWDLNNEEYIKEKFKKDFTVMEPSEYEKKCLNYLLDFEVSLDIHLDLLKIQY